MNSVATDTTPHTGPASRQPIAYTYRKAMAPNTASQNRRPNSSCGSNPRRMGSATIQNFRGGFSRNGASSYGLAFGASQSPDSSMRSTEKE